MEFLKNKIVSIGLIFFITLNYSYSLPVYERNIDLLIPNVVAKGENVTISCEYDLKLNEKHFSVIFWKFSSYIMKIKFYEKDNYNVPHFIRTADNVHFVKKDSKKVEILLTNVTEADTGEYKCSVFAFGDNINYSKEKIMNVINVMYDSHSSAEDSGDNFDLLLDSSELFTLGLSDNKHINNNVNTLKRFDDEKNNYNSGLWSLLEAQKRYVEELNRNKPSLIQFIFPRQITYQNFYLSPSSYEQRYDYNVRPSPLIFENKRENMYPSSYVNTNTLNHILPVQHLVDDVHQWEPVNNFQENKNNIFENSGEKIPSDLELLKIFSDIISEESKEKINDIEKQHKMDLNSWNVFDEKLIQEFKVDSSEYEKENEDNKEDSGEHMKLQFSNIHSSYPEETEANEKSSEEENTKDLDSVDDVNNEENSDEDWNILLQNIFHNNFEETEKSKKSSEEINTEDSDYTTISVNTNVEKVEKSDNYLGNNYENDSEESEKNEKNSEEENSKDSDYENIFVDRNPEEFEKSDEDSEEQYDDELLRMLFGKNFEKTEENKISFEEGENNQEKSMEEWKSLFREITTEEPKEDKKSSEEEENNQENSMEVKTSVFREITTEEPKEDKKSAEEEENNQENSMEVRTSVFREVTTEEPKEDKKSSEEENERNSNNGNIFVDTKPDQVENLDSSDYASISVTEGPEDVESNEKETQNTRIISDMSDFYKLGEGHYNDYEKFEYTDIEY